MWAARSVFAAEVIAEMTDPAILEVPKDHPAIPEVPTHPVIAEVPTERIYRSSNT